MTLSFIAALISSLTITVSNPLPENLANVPVVVPIPASAGNVESLSVSGHPDMPYQIDDTNADGKPDEIVFVVDLAPSETKTLNVSLSPDKETRVFTPTTHAYLKLNDKNKKYPPINAITYPGNVDNKQMYNSIYGHGAVLEGLNNAIRVYMDNRQSVDLYAKNKPQLELETTGFYTTAEQLGQDYGRDILWAGTSVAMGSFRGWQDNQPTTIDSVKSRGQRVVVSGPLRSIIEVTDKEWLYDGKTPVDMVQRYTIYKGHRDYEVEIALTGVPKDAIFATGVQKVMNDNEGFIEPTGLAGSWGNNVPDKSMPQVVDTLGLGISVKAPYLVKTIEDDLNYLTIIKPDSDGIIRYTITAAALRDIESPRNAEEWFAYLKKWRKQLDNPVKITVKIKK